jgi:murein DD-endopeptidase MepM/ murein hydrolase activator NlpD
MSLTLSSFPVCYPAHYHIQETLRVSSPESGSCPLDITFGNDFDASKHRGRLHHAIDIFGAIGLHIVATTSGTVSQHWHYNVARSAGPAAGQSEGGGYYVRLIDDHGFVHYYAHLHRPPMVRSGDRVLAGRVIGLLGQTGLTASSCPHLHYQVRRPLRLSRKRTYSIDIGGNYYSTRGREAVNPYSELVRLCVAAGGRSRGGTSYKISTPIQ